MPVTQEFDPGRDGWYFNNWSQSNLLWDIYKEAYLGINPTYNCEEAPIDPDCIFYDEIFKNFAENGNCAGMSLLALAIFKYGGYMGFCSPAKFFTGGTGDLHSGPDDEALRKAINILHGRQISASGVRYFLDVVNDHNWTDAEATFMKVEELLAKGDYPLLSISRQVGTGHIVIPYRVMRNSNGEKIMFIWDSNFPYNTNPEHYSYFSQKCQLVIRSRNDWIYPGNYKEPYNGSAGALCFAIPMSIWLGKARQPMCLGLAIEEIRSILVTGTGAAMSQISDDEGNRFYKTEADIHISNFDLETDPSRRLKGIGRWPWYGQVEGKELPGELYFMRGSVGNTSALNFTISSLESKMVNYADGNLIEIYSRSPTLSKDMIKISRFVEAAQTIEIKTSGEMRNIDIRQFRTGTKEYDWRSFEIKNVNIARDTPIKIDMLGDMEAIQISSKDREVDFELTIKQRLNAKVSTKTSDRISTISGEVIRVSPDDWSRFEKAKIKTETFKQRS